MAGPLRVGLILLLSAIQLQKRSVDLRVRDLQRANRAVKEAVKNRFEIVFRPIGHDAEILAFHDAGLYT